MRAFATCTRFATCSRRWPLTDVDFRVTADEKAKFLGTWNEHRRVYGYTMLAELHEDLRGVDFDLLLVDEYQGPAAAALRRSM